MHHTSYIIHTYIGHLKGVGVKGVFRLCFGLRFIGIRWPMMAHDMSGARLDRVPSWEASWLYFSTLVGPLIITLYILIWPYLHKQFAK